MFEQQIIIASTFPPSIICFFLFFHKNSLFDMIHNII
jgi:hypothetical protein